MKKIATILGVLLVGLIQAQIVIGTTKTTPSGDALLDFDANTDTGIILPRTTSATAVTGSLVYDMTSKKVQYRKSGSWVDLNFATGTTPSSYNAAKTDNTTTGVIIGANTSSVTGALILESTTKALALPVNANPHLNIKSPEPGMICYDSVSKTVAVFNGTEWAYWK
jgi:hypothetical protein